MSRKPYRHKQAETEPNFSIEGISDEQLAPVLEHFMNPGPPLDHLFLAAAVTGLLVRLFSRNAEDATVAYKAIELAWRKWNFLKTLRSKTGTGNQGLPPLSDHLQAIRSATEMGNSWLPQLLDHFLSVSSENEIAAMEKVVFFTGHLSAKELTKMTTQNPVLLRREYEELAQTIPHRHDFRSKGNLILQRKKWLSEQLGFTKEEIEAFELACRRYKDNRGGPLDFASNDAILIEGLLAHRYGASQSKIHKILAEASHEIVQFFR